VPESLKTPIRCDKVARLRSYDTSRPTNKVLNSAVMVQHGAVRLHGGTESRSYDSGMGQLYSGNYCSPASAVRDYVRSTYELDRIIW